MIVEAVVALALAFAFRRRHVSTGDRSSGGVQLVGYGLAVPDSLGSGISPHWVDSWQPVASNGGGTVVVDTTDEAVTRVLLEVEAHATGAAPSDAITEELPSLDELVPPEQRTVDEVFISYDPDGRRSLVTTGEHDLTKLYPGWYLERTQPIHIGNFRRYLAHNAGAGRYDRLGRGDGPGADAGLRPDDDAPVGPGDYRDYAGGGRQGGARTDSRRDGARPHGARRHRRDSVAGGHLPQRADAGAYGGGGYYASVGYQQRVRSHKHCPGCSGHELASFGWWGLILRLVAGLAWGWATLWILQASGIEAIQGIGFWQYLVGATGVIGTVGLTGGALRRA